MSFWIWCWIPERPYRKFHNLNQLAVVRWFLRGEELPEKCVKTLDRREDKELFLDTSSNYETDVELKSVAGKCKVCQCLGNILPRFAWSPEYLFSFSICVCLFLAPTLPAWNIMAANVLFFNVHTCVVVNAWDWTQSLCEHHKRASTERVDWEKNPMLHWVVKPMLAGCWTWRLTKS